MTRRRSATGRVESMIVPCWNQLPFTRLCLAFLFRHTRRPFERIVIDNGSTDSTAANLACIADGAPTPIRLITNPANLGIAAAVNQRLKAARGESQFLLNNVALITDGRLHMLVAIVDMDGTDE